MKKNQTKEHLFLKAKLLKLREIKTISLIKKLENDLDKIRNQSYHVSREFNNRYSNHDFDTSIIGLLTRDKDVKELRQKLGVR